MSILPNKKQWASLSLPTKYSFFGMALGILGSIMSIGTFVYQPAPSSDIEAKISNLDNIQGALVTLTSYVENQQMVLKRISEEKSTLESERDQIQTALQVDKEKLDSLLEYQLTQQRSGMWLEITISFFIGVLSSSVVTYIASRLQSSRKPRVN